MRHSIEEMSQTTFGIYVFLVKAAEPVAPRDIMRAMNINSPGVVQRHLQKLVDWGWVSKDAYGSFTVKKKVGFKGYVWLGNRLIHTSILFSLAFFAFTISFIALLVQHLSAGGAIDMVYGALIFATIVVAPILLAEALRPKKRQPKEPVKL